MERPTIAVFRPQAEAMSTICLMREMFDAKVVVMVHAKLHLVEPDGELRGVDRNVDKKRQIVEQHDDVVLLSVRHEEASHPVLALSEIRDVRYDEVDPEHLFVREH